MTGLSSLLISKKLKKKKRKRGKLKVPLKMYKKLAVDHHDTFPSTKIPKGMYLIQWPVKQKSVVSRIP